MSTTQTIQKHRLLRMTLAHYRNENCTEEDFHEFATVEHAAQAAKIHARVGMEGYAMYWSPRSFRNAAADLNRDLGNHWFVRDYDMQVEFYFRDFATLYQLASDPDFRRLQAEEGPYVSRIHVEVSIGWVETYVQGGTVVNIGEDGKPVFPRFPEMSASPIPSTEGTA
ncbi:hypothetical protein EV127DRAFT_243593 [Xylaria flabelliformis]|nr:hypothetical protein EV127DRAFT_243593 [Xylaria flabelliformis]KAI0856062.1 hypothetical protein F4860DRAFT_425715 [Xylaria cubensis]